MIKSAIFAGIAAVIMATPIAADVLYECDITDRDERVDWLSPKVAIVLNSGGKSLLLIKSH